MSDESAVGDNTDDLARALELGEFFLVYQPEFDLRTNAFTGVEALLRWRRGGDVLVPDAFVPRLEASGLIVAVGGWAMTTACAQGTTWHNRGYRFRVSLNVAAPQLARSGFADDVATALRSSSFDPALLVLEVSRRTLAGSPANVAVLSSLKELGVRVAVDDFVPETFSLAEIAGWSVDIVKLDRGFVAGLTTSAATSAIRAMMDEARTLGVQIIASGVEDAEQRRQLQLEDVQTGQGYLLARPHEAADIDRFLEDFSIFSGKPL